MQATSRADGRIFEEKVSTRAAQRPGLVGTLDHLRPHAGDTQVVWKLDRLGRSVKDVLVIADDLHARGIGLRILTAAFAAKYEPTGQGFGRVVFQQVISSSWTGRLASRA